MDNLNHNFSPQEPVEISLDSAKQLDLIKTISSQLSIAVDHIMASNGVAKKKC